MSEGIGNSKKFKKGVGDYVNSGTYVDVAKGAPADVGVRIPDSTVIVGDDYLPSESTQIFRTNMVPMKNGNLIMLSNFENNVHAGDINAWIDIEHDLYNHDKSAENFKVTTKDIDFGNPSRRKKIYKVYVTFKAGGYRSGVIMRYSTNDSNTFTSNVFADDDSYYSDKGFDSHVSTSSATTDWITVALKPSSSINNVYSFQLEFSFANKGRINTLAADSNAGVTTITLDSGASEVDDYYNGMLIHFYKNGSGQRYRITDYVGSTQVATLESALDYNVTTSTYYDVGFIPAEFAINDISIIYREKPIK